MTLNKVSRKRRSNNLAFSILFFFMAGILLLAYFSLPDTFKVAAWIKYLFILVAILILTLWGSYTLKSVPNNRSIYLSPPTLISIWILVLLGIPGILGFFDPSLLLNLANTIRVNYEFAVWGWMLVLVGLFALWLGYLIGFKSLPEMKLPGSFLKSKDLSVFVVLLLYFIVTLFRLLQISVIGISYGVETANWGQLASFNQVFASFAGLSVLILAIVAINAFKGIWSSKLLLIVIAIETVFAATSGFKKPMLQIGLVVLIAAIIAKVKSKKLGFFALLLIILAIIVVPIVEELRLQSNYFNSNSPSEVLTASKTAFDFTWGLGVDHGLDLFFENFLSRQAIVAHMPGVIISKTPEVIPFQGVGKFLSIPAYAIPRFLWPEKPILTQGQWFNAVYLGHPEDTISSAALTIFGETYMFAGWPSTILALFIFGILLAYIFKLTYQSGYAALYLALIPVFIEHESQYTTMIIRLFQITITYFFAYWLLSKLSSSLKTKKHPLNSTHLTKFNNS